MPADAYITAATAITWVGVALLAFALLGDALAQRVKRWRGTARKRCPKCWYDLSHTVARASRPCESTADEAEQTHDRDARATGSLTRADDPRITCSECGYVVKRERQFYRGRKRWKLAMFALVMLLGSYALRVTPAVRERGWPAAVPTTALILAMPWMQPTSDGQLQEDATPWRLLSSEFEERLRFDGASWSWQERLVVTLAFRGDAKRPPISHEWANHYGALLSRLYYCSFIEGRDPWWAASADELVQVEARSRSKWPAGSPIYVQFQIGRWNSRPRKAAMIQERYGPSRLSEVEFDLRSDLNTRRMIWWDDHRYKLGVADPSLDVLTVNTLVESSRRRSGGQPIPRVVQIPIHVDGSIHDYLKPIESEAVSNYLRERLDPAIVIDDEKEITYLRLWRDNFMLTKTVPDGLHGLTIALRIEVMRNGIIVSEGEVWYAPTPRREHAREWIWWSPTGAVRIDGLDDAVRRSSGGDLWSVRLRGDPFVALRNFDSDRYWKGEIEVPLRVEVRP